MHVLVVFDTFKLDRSIINASPGNYVICLSPKLRVRSIYFSPVSASAINVKIKSFQLIGTKLN